ncbi:MAG: twin-arginine translocase TatA/TatE family subunit [Sulfurospirillaceae bacterium]|nr:twin-arginine translocase TatA/TatE family subunit [Sulfurospirillaceae bacterium]MCK9545893.1 twin-arginine translocase TatA/TatE family subunit [Sulfurospirillaceae bacterium]MDY0237670.1 twin-arginine translocase TatA/TatE family subunit [Campylobacterales bacterium]NLM99044.1 twin-arginine translocase TatA/TatE family subunit [Campylobacteraceae bacterium]
MGMPSMPELLVILAIVVLLFGAKKIPDLAKGLGKGIKSFKKEMKEDEIEDKTASEEKIEEKAETVKSEAQTKDA